LRKSRILMLAGMALGLALGPARLQAATLSHQPVYSAPADQDILIQATAIGVRGTAQARLYYRPKGRELYSSVLMDISIGQVSGSIPASVVGSQGVEYYLRLADNSGVVSAPPAQPDQNPYFISTVKESKGPEITILSPEEGENLASSRPVVTASFWSAGPAVDPSSIQLLLDGKAVAGFQAFETLVSWVPDHDIPEGEHSVTVRATAGAGVSEATWKFTLRLHDTRFEARPKPSEWAVNGWASTQTLYGLVTQQPRQGLPQVNLPYAPYGANRESMDVTARGPGQTYELKAYVTDEERAEQQPLNRYTAIASFDDGILTLGDSSPVFSPLSLDAPYDLRGLTLDLRSGGLDEGHSRLFAVWGQTRRGANANVGALDVSSTATNGQIVYGVRLEEGFGKWVTWGLNNVTINDDTTGLDQQGAPLPVENTLMSSDMAINLRPIWLTLKGEAAGDIYARDSSVTGFSVGGAYTAGAHFNALPIGTKLDFEWRDLGGALDVQDFTFPGGYATLGDPSLQLDYRGYESGISQSLFSGQVLASYAWNRWRDNLQENGLKPTTTTDFQYASLSLQPAALPYLILGYGLNATHVDAEGNTAFSSLQGDQLSPSLSGTLGYARPLAEGSLNASFSYNENRSLGSFTNRSHTLSLGGSLGRWNGQANASYGGTEYAGIAAGGVTYTATAIPGYFASIWGCGLHLGRAFIPRVVDGSLGYDLNSQASDDPSQARSVRHTFSVGSGYSPTGWQRISLDLAWSLVDADGASLADGSSLSNQYSELYASLKYKVSF